MAFKIQNFFRLSHAKFRTREMREALINRKKNHAAMIITRFFKYIVPKTKIQKFISEFHRFGAVGVQRVGRGFLARKRYVLTFNFHPNRL